MPGRERSTNCSASRPSSGWSSKAFNGLPLALACRGCRTPRIAELLVECHGLTSQLAHPRRAHAHSLAKCDGRHLVLAAGNEERFYVHEALATPEAEEHAVVLGADEQNRSVGEIDKMAPFHDLLDS